MKFPFIDGQFTSNDTTRAITRAIVIIVNSQTITLMVTPQLLGIIGIVGVCDPSGATATSLQASLPARESASFLARFSQVTGAEQPDFSEKDVRPLAQFAAAEAAVIVQGLDRNPKRERGRR